MQIALIGQPNCGKSTLFNQVAGYKAETGNFSGTTVTFTESKVRVGGEVITLIDLPGTYTLVGTNPAEREVMAYLTSHAVDAIINVIDATHLSQGLELTLELLELGKPVVVGLNMIDEARRRGIDINGPGLMKELNTPVLPLIASRGRGVKELFLTALKVGQNQTVPQRFLFSPEIERVIERVTVELKGLPEDVNPVPAAVKLLEGDSYFVDLAARYCPDASETVEAAKREIEERRTQPTVWVISGERHTRAAHITGVISKTTQGRTMWWDRLDDVLLHPVFGYFILSLILFLFFEAVYTFGSWIEVPMSGWFAAVDAQLVAWMGKASLLSVLVRGMVQGIAGGVTIALPYLLPFLFGLSFLEDVGYLPRVAFLMDSMMHRLGLHGKAIVPFILGYGCNVPAIMSTRIMEEKRDRFLAAALATMVPCAARLSVVFGLVAFYVGPLAALVIYIFNLFVIALTSRLLSKLMPEDTPGLILEMPMYRMPTFKTIFSKVWFRVKEFIFEAWPILIVGSGVLALLNYFNLSDFFNTITLPITWILGLPKAVGVPLIFGVLRKELSLIMLRQALGGAELSTVLTAVQMVTFSVFVVFYVPCLATLVAIRKELGNRTMLEIAGMTIVIAMLTGLAARGVSLLIL